MNNTVKNPYVGPRTFQREDGDIFFGREREARDIMALVASERLVLFYAQSGAGKSSLLNTRIIPELEDGEFEVLPVGRVQGDLPLDLEVENVYVFNLMNSLLQQKTNPQALAKLSLSEFLCMLDFNEGGYSFNAKRTTAINMELHWRRILIIDQFEEIFTTHLDAWIHRSGFFCQLAQALQDAPYLTIILTMRDDYIASLDLYAHLLPGGLRTRYYMQRLTKETALKAVKNPVENIRPFSAGVAEKLVEDLSGIVVYRPGGVQEIQSGQYVEPVQLQVVCYSLWENLSPEGTEITAEDLQEVGDVDQSLESFYNHRVAAVAKEREISERTIREWFDKELVTGNKTRNMVLQGKGNSAGLPNDVIQALQGDLVRTELRAGQIWIELSHDRLVEPLLASNAKWFEGHLSIFQQRVVLWVQQGKSESLLLGARELEETEREAAALQLTADEQEFLEKCRILQKRNQRDRRQRRLIASALIASIILLIVAISLFFDSKNHRIIAENIAGTAEALKVESDNNAKTAKAAQITAENNAHAAETAKAEADEQAKNALAGSLAAQADSIKDSDHALALLLGVEAYNLRPDLLTRTTLFNLLQYTPYKRFFGFKGPIASLAISPDGKWTAISSSNQISIIDSEKNLVIARIEENLGLVNSLAFNNDGSLLAAAGCLPEDCFSGGQITIWNMTNLQQSTRPEDIRTGHTAQIQAIAFSPDGKYLASGGRDRMIFLWDVSSSGKLSQKQSIGTPAQGQFILSLAYSPDGKTLVSGEADGSIHLWNVSDPSSLKPIGIAPPQHTKEIYSIAFGPPGSNKFASASVDKTAVLWDWDPVSRFLKSRSTLEGHTGFVQSVAFNSEGTILASASLDGSIILWNAQTGQQIGPALIGNKSAVNALTFGRSETKDVLFSGSNDHTVTLWELSTRQPISQPIKEPPQHANIGKQVKLNDIQATADGQQINILNNAQEAKSLIRHTGAVNTLSIDPQRINGRLLLASASDDQTVIVWDVTSVKDADVFLKLEGFNDPVSSAYFSNDGKFLYTESSGQTTQWIIDPEEWVRLTCEIMKSSLTKSDREEKYRKVCENNP